MTLVIGFFNFTTLTTSDLLFIVGQVFGLAVNHLIEVLPKNQLRVILSRNTVPY